MILDLATAKGTYLKDVQHDGDDDAITAHLAAIDVAIAQFCGYGDYAGAAPATVEDKSYTLYLTGVPDRSTSGPWASNVPLYNWSHTGLTEVTTAGSARLLLPIWPVVSITSIHEDETWQWGDDTEVSSDDYLLFEDTWALVKRPNKAGWSTVTRAIKVVLVAGWEDIDAPMQQAAGLQLVHLWKNRTLVGKTSEAIDGASAGVRPFTLLPAVQALLQPYRITAGRIG